MKTLRSQAYKLASVYYNLRNTPPKEFQSVDDMEKMVAIVDKIAIALPLFKEHFEYGDELKAKIMSGQIKSNGEDGDKNNIQKLYADFDTKTNDLIETHGKEIAEVEFEDAEFNSLFQFNSKWGKTWFAKVPEYIDFLKDLNETNKQPKDK